MPDGLDQAGDPAELGLHPGLDDDGPGLARDDGRPQVDDVRPVGQRDFASRPRADAGLQDGRRFARQARFLDGEVGRVPDDPAVGRDMVAGFELDEVAGHEVGRRRSTPDRRRGRPGRSARPFFSGPEAISRRDIPG